MIDFAKRPEEPAPSIWWLAIFAAAWLGALSIQPMPDPRAPSEFDTASAYRELETLCLGPRLGGNAYHTAALDQLEQRLESAGHGVERFAGRILGLPMVDLVCVSEGTESTGTVLVMAHYDSRAPDCPGASDDGIGTVAALQIFTTLAAAPHRNDLVLLLTDGEELGLHGATLFVERHPLAVEIDAVVNLESLGNGGPAWLFETGPEDGRWIRRFAREAPLPIGDSLAEWIYRTAMKRRNTDFTRFRDRGVGGFNFANVWGTKANHQAFDTPANLTLASLTHLGESGLAATRILVEENLSAPKEAEPAFFEVPGIGMVAIAPWLSSALAWLAVALGLAVAWRGARTYGASSAVWSLCVGLGALLAALGCSLGASHLVAEVVSWFGPEHVPTGNETSMRLFAVGVGLFSGGVFAAVAARLARCFEVFLVPWAIATVWLELVTPLSSHAASVPLLVTAVVALAPRPLRPLLAAAGLSFVALFLGPLLRTLPQIISQLLTPSTLAGAFPNAALVALLLVPFGPALAKRPRLAVDVLAVGGALLAWWAVGDARGW
ncbi:MAG: M28 family peptidase [Planctomycetota bacterium]